jgi:hypothetical protein
MRFRNICDLESASGRDPGGWASYPPGTAEYTVLIDGRA